MNKAPGNFSYYLWPSIVVACLLFSIGLNIYLFTLANDVQDKSILVEEKPYEEGLNYQEKINEEGLLTKLGWTLDYKILNTSKVNSREVALSIKDKQGVAISGLSIILALVRPNSQAADSRYELIESRNIPGEYKTTIDAVSGFWWINLSIAKDKIRARKHLEVNLD